MHVHVLTDLYNVFQGKISIVTKNPKQTKSTYSATIRVRYERIRHTDAALNQKSPLDGREHC